MVRKPVKVPLAVCGTISLPRRHVIDGTVAASSGPKTCPAASARIASSGSPMIMASTCGARLIDSPGTVEACGPNDTSAAPKCAFRRAISSTSASSVGVVLGKTISSGRKPSASSCAIAACVESFAAV